MEEKKYKSDLEMIREGSILKEYNIKKNFVNVTPAPTIGKVKISIVALNSGGKDFVDFYLDIDEFRQFCKEIDNGVAQKRIMEDNSPYPSAYKWTAGTNGCRHFNVGKGRAGVVLQVQNTAKKQSKMVAVTPHSLKKMAFLFRLLMGLVPVTPKAYYSNLIYEFYVNEAKRSSYYKKDIQNGDFETNDSLDAPEEDHMGSGQQAQAPSSQQSQKTAPAQAKPQPQTQNNVPAGQTDPFAGQKTQTQAPAKSAAPSSGNPTDNTDPFAIFDDGGEESDPFIPGSNGLAGWGNQ